MNINGSGCVDSSQIPLPIQTTITKLYQKAAFVILFCGIVGNSMAIFVLIPPLKLRRNRVVSRGNTSNKVNNFILTLFHIMSLIAVLTLIIIPIMRFYSDQRRYGFWITKSWAVYSGDAHYPIANGIISFTFLLYFVYFANQVLAVAFPHKYKSMVTHRNLYLVLGAIALYCVVWYIPTWKWLEVIAIQLCPKVGEAKGMTIYITKEWQPETVKGWRMWTTYQILREILVNIIPFLSIILFKLIVLLKRQKQKNIICPAISSKINVNDTRVDSLQGPSCTNVLEASRKVSSEMFSNLETTGISRTANSLMSGRMEGSPSLRRSNEAKQHKKTLFILTCEFLIFMLPFNIYEILISFGYHLIDPVISSDTFQIVSMLRFINLAFSFYVNYAFNSFYREKVNKLWTKFKEVYIKR